MTQKYLKSIIEYNQKTGQFISLVNRGKKCKVGDVIGTVNDKGYLVAYINKKQYRLHRLAFLYVYGYFPIGIDHRNRITTDNRMKNLKEATQSENQKNLSKRKDNASGITGVRWDRKRGKWKVQITVNKKQHHLGMYKNVEDAIDARKKAQKQFGFSENHGV